MSAHYFLFPRKGCLLYATLVLCLLNQFCYCQTRAQIDVYYNPIKPLLRLHQSSQVLATKLDSLTTTLRFSRSSISTLFDRDIDFGISHRRTIIHTNIIVFQLDAVSENGRIIALTTAIVNINDDSIKGESILLQSCDTSAVLQFLANRNSFYQSHKSLPNFFTELQDNEQFALTCGDGSPITSRGTQIQNLAHHSKVDSLAKMLTSIHCETQAYAVAGFDMMKGSRKISLQQRLVIKHIKQRNSVVVTCAGCLSGLRRTIY